MISLPARLQTGSLAWGTLFPHSPSPQDSTTQVWAPAISGASKDLTLAIAAWLGEHPVMELRVRW
jgi:hypothetical protein